MADGKKDYYELLGVDRGAGDADIKRAFRALARQHHPDANPGDPAAEERFKEINEAYSILSDPEKRARYDRYGHAGVANGAGGGVNFDPFGFSDIFEAFFGAGGGVRDGRRVRVPEVGADLHHELELTLAEAAVGVEREIAMDRTETCPICAGSGAKPGTVPATCPLCGGAGQVRQAQNTAFGRFVNVRTCERCAGSGSVATTPCPDCRGSGKQRRTRKLQVKVPPGVDNDSRLRLSREGHAGEHGGPPGDLYVSFRIPPHPDLKREGTEIYVDRAITMTQAALGTELTVPTLEGETTVRIPPGTQGGAVFTLRGKGMPDPRGFGRGHQHVRVSVTIPGRLSERQRELLREFAKVGGEEIAEPSSRNPFRRR
jgi:molecular chaperone DnaJ